MKKFLPLLLLLVSSIFIFSCKDDDDDYVQVDVDYPAVYDLNLSLIQIETNNYGYNQPFNRPMLSQDIVLVYRKSNPGESTPVWAPLPKKYYFGSDDMDYTFDFTTTDVQLDLLANFNLSLQNTSFKNTYLNGQTFRVVLVPAVVGKNVNSADLSKMPYEEVIKKFNIDESKVGTL